MQPCSSHPIAAATKIHPCKHVYACPHMSLRMPTHMPVHMSTHISIDTTSHMSTHMSTHVYAHSNIYKDGCATCLRRCLRTCLHLWHIHDQILVATCAAHMQTPRVCTHARTHACTHAHMRTHTLHRYPSAAATIEGQCGRSDLYSTVRAHVYAHVHAYVDGIVH